ncbi:MAG: flagellar biosynthetic protein FliR [Hyphomonadaceae bacterium]|nr:MAG: flagellar biosynthetic protein FliR [Caulobacteraceae bacterium]MBT9445306.1 flagellar biosynthetic protein FliR [Hyphomonadaceae bacterium]
MAAFADQLALCLLASLRIGPTLAFAPPFTLMRVPATVRAGLALALAAWIVSVAPPQTHFSPAAFVSAAFAELGVGIGLAFCLQWAFAALQTAGQAIDIQAGFGLAGLVDPTLRTQTPLTSALFAYGAGAVFFASSGPHDLLAVWARSFEIVPIGGFDGRADLAGLAEFLAAAFVLALGAGGLVLLALFVIDLAIAFMSRTLPQMNVLMLGFQVKTMAVLLVLPLALGVGAATFVRLLRLALAAAPATM